MLIDNHDLEHGNHVMPLGLSPDLEGNTVPWLPIDSTLPAFAFSTLAGGATVFDEPQSHT